MKKHILLLLILFHFSFSYAQNSTLATWKQVEKYELKGQVKDAEQLVEKILTSARSNDQPDQIIKAFIYKSKFALLVNDKNLIEVLKDLEIEIAGASFPTKQLLHYVYGNLLEKYYDHYYWKRKKKDNITDGKIDNLNLWSNDLIRKKIEEQYEASLEPAHLLMQQSLNKYIDLLKTEGASNKSYRTLYGFFAHHIIDYYKDHYKTQSIKSEYHSILMGDKTTFCNFSFTKASQKTTVLKAFIIYQKLYKQPRITQYQTTKLDIDRLQFANNILDNDEEYIEILEQMVNDDSTPSQDYIKYTLTNKLTWENFYNDHLIDRLKIVKLYEAIVSNNNNTDITLKAIRKKEEITSPSASLLVDGIVYPGQPSLAKVTYRNMDSITISIYPFPESLKTDNLDSLFYVDYMVQKPILKKTYALPFKKNYEENSTELIIPALEPGKHLVITSKSSSPLNRDNILDHSRLVVSRLSIHTIAKEDSVFIRVCDRQNGSPISKASLYLTLRRSGGKEVLEDNGKTNKQGLWYCDLLLDRSYYSAELSTSYKKDTLLDVINKYNNYRYISNPDEKYYRNKTLLSLFTDRSIYRPGQMVYFKGILHKASQNSNNDKINRHVVANESVFITLTDAEKNKVKTVHLRTNEFGSVHDSIQLPMNRKNGQYRLTIKSSDEDTSKQRRYFLNDNQTERTVTFSVESYKRPTFKIKFNPIKQFVTANDSARVNGIATSLNGTPIINASVKYSIKRVAPYSYWSVDEDESLSTSSATTDKNGQFTVAFLATPSYHFKKSKSNDTYHVTVEVTDQNGETHEKTKSVTLSDKDIATSCDVKNDHYQDRPLKFNIATRNSNGSPINTKVNVRIYPAPTAEKVYFTRHWSFPDTVTIPKKTFTKLFPQYKYKKEEQHWDIQKEEPIYEKDLNSDSKYTLAIDHLNKWKCGKYKLVIEAINAIHDTLISTRNFQILPALSKNKVLPTHLDYSAEIKNDSTIMVRLATTEKGLTVFMDAYALGKDIGSRIIKMHNEIKRIEIPYHGNKIAKINFQFYYMKYGHFVSHKTNVTYAPTKRNQLQIETLSFRDKMEPGTKEKWSFRIVDSTQTVNGAELLASMYDASLDIFRSHRWSPSLSYPSYNYYIPSIHHLKHENIQSNEFYKKSFFYLPSTTVWSFNWFGLCLNPYSYRSNNKTYLKQLILKRQLKEGTRRYVYGFVLDQQNKPVANALIHIDGDNSAYKTYDNGFYILPADKNIRFKVSKYGYKTLNCTTDQDGIKNLRLTKSANYRGLSIIEFMDQLKCAKLLDEKIKIRDLAFRVPGSPADAKISKVITIVDDDEEILDDEEVDDGTSTILQCVEEEGVKVKGASSLTQANLIYIIDGEPATKQDFESILPKDIAEVKVLDGSKATAIYGSKATQGVVIVTTKDGLTELMKVTVRENLKETAFFYPELHTDKDGVVSFEFTSPEAITRWKLMLFAHNKNFDFGQKTLTTVTQKEVSITPNAPRFLREGDRVVFGAKIDNLSDEKQMGTAMLVLYDATNGKEISSKEVGLDATKPFKIKAKNSQAISWEFTVPSDIYSLKYKMIAKAKKHSDGEANVLPVLSKKVLVTESMPIWVNPQSTEGITFKNLQDKQHRASDHRLMLEYTPNTLWNVIEALPYLIEYPYGCTEQTFSKYYANAMALHLLEKNPKIKTLFEKWKDNPAMTIEMMNPELRSSLLEATPWINQLDNDTTKKAKLARLLDRTTLLKEQRKALERVRTMQLPSGAFPWFAGGRPNEYITQHILVTLSHIKKLDADKANRTTLDAIAKNAIGYLDRQFLGRFNRIKDNTLRYTDLKPIDIHYLYIRSHFIKEVPMSSELKKIVNKQLQIIKENWIIGTMYEQAMTAICFQNMGEYNAAKQIIKSFDQYAIYSAEKGMYWHKNSYNWFWYRAKIETHVMIMDAYQQVEGNLDNKIEKMKQGLLYYKKNQHWPTTKTTTEAIYALLSTGNTLEEASVDYTIKIGDRTFDSMENLEKSEEEITGNIQVTWTPKKVTDKDATITIENRGTTIGTGAAYWQYWQELNDIQSNPNAPVFIQKKLYKQEADGNTLKWVPVDQHHIIHLGDKVKVQLNVESKENLEFVHLKDLRASGFEPIDVISKYHYSSIGYYYKSTKDVATHFYFDYLHKGKCTFEYEVRANNKGDYTGGNATIQSMYAPEYGNTSKSRQVTIK
ncbi:hypothetical protein K5X82_05110 [Halosquirtibacter xylanolyticus]|uniref:alpha-2-macroglobulin family protein n=1 Tax=Halosquirtibacter xylanolyticus TaxID=3374599 RepID=UPI0037486EBE|nr:hypothetical protein K5X82_05110 [Prolixibacteraceae bacterium]